MLVLPDIHPKPVKTAGKAKRHPASPHYHGRWPFIAAADISGATQPGASQQSGGRVAAVEGVSPEATPKLSSSTGLAQGDLDKVVTGIRQSPLQAVAIAAGVGFALALIAR